MSLRFLTPLALVAGLFVPGWLHDTPALLPSRSGMKPMFPVLARLALLNSPLPGGVARVSASVTAWVPGEDVAFNVLVPSGLEVISGSSSWSGQLGKGETKTFELSLLVPDGSRYELEAVARLPERPNIRSAAGLAIDLGTLEGARASERVVIGEGVTHLQYQGEVRPR